MGPRENNRRRNQYTVLPRGRSRLALLYKKAPDADPWYYFCRVTAQIPLSCTDFLSKRISTMGTVTDPVSFYFRTCCNIILANNFSFVSNI